MTSTPSLARRANRRPRIGDRTAERNGESIGFLSVAARIAREWFVERRLRARDGSFRSTDTERIERAYGAMSTGEFDTINAPQDWANRRVIPRAFAAYDKRGPWRVLDLGCGAGGSTQVVGLQLPAGSVISGYDVCPRLLARARERRFRARDGGDVAVDFVCQSIDAPMRDAAGDPLADDSVDVVHSAGVVGHHLDERSLDNLAKEIARVLRRDGLAILDAGPRNPPRALTSVMRRHHFECLARHRLLPFNPRAAMVFRMNGRGGD